MAMKPTFWNLEMTAGVSEYGVLEYFVPEVWRSSGTVDLGVQGFCVQFCCRSPTVVCECSTRSSTGFVYSLNTSFVYIFPVDIHLQFNYKFFCKISMLTFGNCTQNFVLRVLPCQMTVGVSEFLFPKSDGHLAL
jgi:hypothetical protein